jgi:transglutaminase-like putative cysteine protease
MYQISHNTTYTYDRPVTLSPHVIRLRPRSDIAQKLHQFSLTVSPIPQRISESVDLDGNSITKVWFPEAETTRLSLQTLAQVETYCTNPFNYLLEPWAAELPMDYPTSLSHQLQPYLSGQFSQPIDPIATQLSQELWQSTAGNTLAFLNELRRTVPTGNYLDKTSGFLSGCDGIIYGSLSGDRASCTIRQRLSGG